jgi:hypothetical protein
LVNVDVEKDKSISLRTLVGRINLVGTVIGVTKLWSQIDRSIVESFGGGGRTCMTARAYPEHLATGSAHLYVFNNGTRAVKVSNPNSRPGSWPRQASVVY